MDGESAQFIHSSSIYHQHRSPNNFTRALIFTQTEDHTFETLPLLGRRNSNSFHLQRYSRRYFDLNNSHFAFISNHLSTYSKRKAVDVPMHDHEGASRTPAPFPAARGPLSTRRQSRSVETYRSPVAILPTPSWEIILVSRRGRAVQQLGRTSAYRFQPRSTNYFE